MGTLDGVESARKRRWSDREDGDTTTEDDPEELDKSVAGPSKRMRTDEIDGHDKPATVDKPRIDKDVICKPTTESDDAISSAASEKASQDLHSDRVSLGRSEATLSHDAATPSLPKDERCPDFGIANPPKTTTTEAGQMNQLVPAFKFVIPSDYRTKRSEKILKTNVFDDGSHAAARSRDTRISMIMPRRMFLNLLIVQDSRWNAIKVALKAEAEPVVVGGRLNLVFFSDGSNNTLSPSERRRQRSEGGYAIAYKCPNTGKDITRG